MKCPYCHISIHVDWKTGEINSLETRQRIVLNYMTCPDCKNIILNLIIKNPNPLEGAQGNVRYTAAPRFSNTPPIVTDGVSDSMIEDYKEACVVLPIGAKASAALSRRILQAILKEQGYESDNLARKIDDVLNEEDPKKALPLALHSTVDAIRNFGNFSAHPITDKTSLQMIDIEPEEAEWCLDIIRELFDHYYVNPTLARERKAKLDAKLQAAGKPPSK